MRFRTLLWLSLILPLAVTAAAVMAVMYASADRHSTELAHKLLGSVTAQAAQELYAHSERAVGLAVSLKEMGPAGLSLTNQERLSVELARLLRAHEDVTWISFSNPHGDFTGAFRRGDGTICINESHIVDGKTAMVEQVLDAADRKTPSRQDPDTGYDPRKRPFYLEAMKHKGLVWSPPYIFYEQGIPGISCAVPVFRQTSAGEELIGVFSVDYDLNYLSELAGKLATSPKSRVMVFTADHVLLAHSAVRVAEMNGRRADGVLMTPADVKDASTQALMGKFKELGLGEKGPVPGQQSLSLDAEGVPQVACLLPTRLEAGPRMYVAAIAPKSDFAPSAWDSSRHAFLVVLIAFIGAGLLAYLVARRFSAPVSALVKAAEQIGTGDLEVSVSLGPIHEFRKLSAAFHAMLANLRDSVRVRTSLALTREIQRRLLPLAPPRVHGYDVAGYSAYCDETGGDYYDYLVLPKAHAPGEPGTLILVLGDMMGHGLPAALLMAGARGALRSAVKTCSTPADLLTHLNDVFFRDTDGQRFMTMCLVAFDLERCEVKWASAGHDPPLIYDPAERLFHEPEGGDVPLGVMEHVAYVDYGYDRTCAGQILCLGSDGVWETYSPAREQFGKERLKALLQAHAHRTAEEIKTEVLFALDEFRGGNPVGDDVTFIILKFLPQPALLQRQAEESTDQKEPVRELLRQ
jgi:sigma-B regulation protein RsbU (phosphoserine phosphatase)